MKHIFLIILFMCLGTLAVPAQQTRSLVEHVRSVRVVVNNDVLQPPVARLDGPVEISFDDLSHAYTRYIYKVELCNADWQPATEVFESDWLEGFNERPIEDYEKSLNTTLLYTHYRIAFPSEDMRLLLPGNYRVRVYDDDDEEREHPVLEACFALLEPRMSIRATVTTHTDIDVNASHQQCSFAVSYGALRVIDPVQELRTVVLQNRRWDSAVQNLPPNIRSSSGAEWTHRRELIFPAGNEFHKFELLDVRQGGMGIDRMECFDPHYHATLFPVTPSRHYVTDEDVNGAYVIRHLGDEDNDTQSEYVFVHFLFDSPRLPGGNLYVNGLWSNGFPDPQCRMTYDEMLGCYEATVLLKQGYYNYQILQEDAESLGLTDRTDGNFYETENEYIVLIYHRPQGARYDALVGYTRINK